jgi:hypothetical protein
MSVLPTTMIQAPSLLYGRTVWPGHWLPHLWVPKTRATLADALRDAVGSVTRRGAWRAVWFGLACNDLRLVGLKLIFLVVTRAVSVLGLSRREAWWKDAEILMLRHQLAVALAPRHCPPPVGRPWLG